jgi:sensor histidine kinase regulating citrate/malate metabolism
MRKEMIVSAVLGLLVGVGIMWFFGDKIKAKMQGFTQAPAKAK